MKQSLKQGEIPGWNRICSERKVILYYVNRSLNTLCKNTAAKRDPTEVRGMAKQKRRETSTTKCNNCQEVKQPFYPEISQDVQGFQQRHKLLLIWPKKRCITGHTWNRISFPSATSLRLVKHKTVFWHISPLEKERLRFTKSTMWTHISSWWTIYKQHP